MTLDKLQMPNGQESVENIKFGLLEDKVDANFIKNNLESLNNEIANVNGDLSRLGIKLDDLKHIYQKLDGKRDKFGEDFPVSQVEALTKTIEQVETVKSEQEAQNTDSDVVYTPETIKLNEQATIRSTIDAYSAWRRIIPDVLLSNTGNKWNDINRQITDHLNKLKALKGLEVVQKGKMAEKDEDEMIAVIDNAQQLKNWHDKLGAQPQYQKAA